MVADALAPTFSRDGKLLAYVSKVGGDVPHIWIRQTTGARAVQATKGASRDSNPDFSPDATQIAYASQNERPGVYIAQSFGGESALFTTVASVLRKWHSRPLRAGRALPSAGVLNRR
jgi:Tol biopolymer transport system component